MSEAVVKREAIFWDCNDSETLRLESPEEAIEQFFDSYYDKDFTIVEQIQKCCPLAVKGYAREEVDPTHSKRLAEAALENFVEMAEEDYGDPDGNSELLEPKDRDMLTAALELAFAQALSKITVWRCEVVDSLTYSATEVEAILRAECPDWFEAPR